MSDVVDVMGHTRMGAVAVPDRTVIETSRRHPAPDGAVPEFVRLFQAVRALNAKNQPFVLQFIATAHGEGTSTVAAGFAVAAARENASSVLLIDCTPSRDAAARARSYTPSLIEAFRSSATLGSALRAPSAQVPAMARLSDAPGGVLDIGPAELQRLFALLRQSFSVVVLDCPPPAAHAESLALSRYCDGSALVVRAEMTRAGTISATKDMLERFGGQVVGIAFNRRRTYLPGWLQRRF